MSDAQAVPEGYRDADLILVETSLDAVEFFHIPVLVHPGKEKTTSEAYGAWAARAKAQGIGLAVLSLDNDGYWQWLLSTRHHGDWPFANRLKLALQAFGALREHIPQVGVALCVEELCPGGLDPTEGIAIAQAFEFAGASFVVASGGTADFPALKWRRPTQKKDQAETHFADENEIWLASATWLAGRLSIPVFAQGPVQSHQKVRMLAQQCGLTGFVSAPALIES